MAQYSAHNGRGYGVTSVNIPKGGVPSPVDTLTELPRAAAAEFVLAALEGSLTNFLRLTVGDSQRVASVSSALIRSLNFVFVIVKGHKVHFRVLTPSLAGRAVMPPRTPGYDAMRGNERCHDPVTSCTGRFSGGK